MKYVKNLIDLICGDEATEDSINKGQVYDFISHAMRP